MRSGGLVNHLYPQKIKMYSVPLFGFYERRCNYTSPVITFISSKATKILTTYRDALGRLLAPGVFAIMDHFVNFIFLLLFFILT